jgi:hypothetical protein
MKCISSQVYNHQVFMCKRHFGNKIDMNSDTNKPQGIAIWVEVDLDELAYNVGAVKQHVGERVEVFAVVKANAYGHDTVQVSQTALRAGVTCLAVHRAIEAVELRQARISSQGEAQIRAE